MNKITKKILIEKILLLSKDEIDEFYQAEIPDSNVVEKKHKNKFMYSLSYSSTFRKIQSNINSALNPLLDLNNSAIAYRTGLSYFDFLEPHAKNYHFLRMDISLFFHSLNIDDVKEAISQYIDDDIINTKHNQKLIDVIIKCISYKIPKKFKNTNLHDKTILPMGFSTSPIISNITFRKIDILIQKLCAKLDITYTRYADDMLFSTPRDKKIIHSEFFLKEIKILVSLLGLKINAKKTIVKSHTISLNGYIIQNQIRLTGFAGLFSPISPAEIRLSNKKTAIIDKLLHHILVKKSDSDVILNKLFKEDVRDLMHHGNKEKYVKEYSLDQILNKLTGYRSFLLSIISHNKKFNSTSVGTIKKYSSKITKIEKCINIIDKKKIYT
ncbi:RNA-directed DNA polymerase [Pectobacterium brasiliense]|uniref:reverse transcriptase family protein n=1 Tax=Pectobacterium brasiliense TaxID=180957 RepID=UPI001968FA2F|nr:reverse transcriptase family protein [Pectobacterium brasiliense]MBN3253183.1 RNA-directed DNA polymerase [Pectobacterium brasiliense]